MICFQFFVEDKFHWNWLLFSSKIAFKITFIGELGPPVLLLGLLFWKLFQYNLRNGIKFFFPCIQVILSDWLKEYPERKKEKNIREKLTWVKLMIWHWCVLSRSLSYSFLQAQNSIKIYQTWTWTWIPVVYYLNDRWLPLGLILQASASLSSCLLGTRS